MLIEKPRSILKLSILMASIICKKLCFTYDVFLLYFGNEIRCLLSSTPALPFLL